MKLRIWDEIKYYITMTGLVLAMTGLVLAMIGVVLGSVLLFAPIVLAFVIATIGGWKFLIYILSL